MGISISRPSYIDADNMLVIHNTSKSESTIKKKHNSITFNAIHESVTKKESLTVAWHREYIDNIDQVTQLLWANLSVCICLLVTYFCQWLLIITNSILCHMLLPDSAAPSMWRQVFACQFQHIICPFFIDGVRYIFWPFWPLSPCLGEGVLRFQLTLAAAQVCDLGCCHFWFAVWCDGVSLLRLLLWLVAAGIVHHPCVVLYCFYLFMVNHGMVFCSVICKAHFPQHQ